MSRRSFGSSIPCAAHQASPDRKESQAGSDNPCNAQTGQTHSKHPAESRRKCEVERSDTADSDATDVSDAEAAMQSHALAIQSQPQHERSERQRSHASGNMNQQP